MTDIYVMNEEIKKTIEELKDLMIIRLRKVFGYFWSSYTPTIIFSEMNEDPRMGYFTKEQNLIVLNMILLDDSLKEEREAVFLHELAHWAVYRKYGSYTERDHGKEFVDACRELGVPEDFEGATAKIRDWGIRKQNAERKVKKLLSLGNSPFEAEAESAMSKARSMMNQYSLSYLLEDDNRLFAVDGTSYQRIDSWRKSLYHLVADLSGCYRILVQTSNGTHISYFGSREQVESAVYFQTYFEDALESEYKKNKKNLHGITQKNAFLLGLCNSLYRKAFTTGKTTSIIQSQKKSEERYKELSEGRIYYTHSRAGAGDGYYLGSSAASGMDIPSRESACRVRRIGYNG